MAGANFYPGGMAPQLTPDEIEQLLMAAKAGQPPQGGVMGLSVGQLPGSLAPFANQPQPQLPSVADAPQPPPMSGRNFPAYTPMQPQPEPTPGPVTTASIPFSKPQEERGLLRQLLNAPPAVDKALGKLGDIGSAFMATDPNLARGAAAFQSMDAENATAKWLAANVPGVSPEAANQLAKNPVLMQSVLVNAFKPKTQVVNNKLINSTTGQMIADYSDAATKGPDVKEFTLPDGSKVTGIWNAVTKRHELPNGQPIPASISNEGIPPNVNAQKYRSEMATDIAKSVAAARTQLPETLRMLDSQLALIDDLYKSGSYASAVGPINSRLPTVSDATADAEAKIKQIGGASFLQAFNALKGSGAISNAEGAKAEAAINRLGILSQSQAGYKQALEEARSELQKVREIVQRRAAGNFEPLEGNSGSHPDGTVARNPQTGETLVKRNGQWVPQ